MWKKYVMWLFLVLILIGGSVYLSIYKQFGKNPSNARLARVQASANYVDGRFRNQVEKPLLTEDVSKFGLYMDFLFSSPENTVPKTALPSQKTDLKALSKTDDTLVWFGHSSYFLQIAGKRMLVDPVFSNSASPFSFMIRAFPGTTNYQVDDLPEIDYVFITHDHWDHLDYETVIALNAKTGKFICGLGVGEHLEYWGVAPKKIIELDWYEAKELDNSEFTVHAMPTHHFSGRGLNSNQTLWVSFVLQAPGVTLYFGGDSGYGPHFAEIGGRFDSIDLAILENGQYDTRWKYTHMHPEEVVQAAHDLHAKALLPVHSGKFSLSAHAWNEPLQRISALHSKGESFRLLTPMIGERVDLSDQEKKFAHWWEQ